MHIKRFEAESLEKALANVRAEMGEDALILASRTLRRERDRFGLLARTVVEVQAARERGSEAAMEPDSATEALPRPPSPRELGGWDPRGFEGEIRAELAALRQAVEALSLRDVTPPGPVTDHALEWLAWSGLASATGERVVAQWQAQRVVRPGLGLEGHLRESLQDRFVPPRPVDGKRVRLLVGAPGVGKTTTLAKLAARSEEGERDVTLVGLDQYRVGGIDVLKRYAERLESPFVDAADAEAVLEVASSARDREVLVDTTGRSRGDDFESAAVGRLRERLGGQLEVELVIDATARLDVQRTQLQRFAALRPDRVVVTKTDECERPAPIVDLLLDPACPPVCWRGTGQRVPEDLEGFDAGPLVRSLFRVAA